jgi:hypothetical protein
MRNQQSLTMKLRRTNTHSMKKKSFMKNDRQKLSSDSCEKICPTGIQNRLTTKVGIVNRRMTTTTKSGRQGAMRRLFPLRPNSDMDRMNHPELSRPRWSFSG